LLNVKAAALEGSNTDAINNVITSSLKKRINIVNITLNHIEVYLIFWYNARAIMRCFLAIVPPKGISQSIYRYHQQFELGQHFKQTQSSSFHITFEFYSDLPENLSKKLSEQMTLELAELDRFEITTGEYTTFPNRAHSKILVLKVLKSKGFYRVKETIVKINQNYLINSQTKRFAPHLTVGRWSKPFHIDKPLLNEMTRKKERISFMADELVLFRSKLSQYGATYTKLNSFSFKNED